MTNTRSPDEYGLHEKVAIVTGAGGERDYSDNTGISNGQAAAIQLARAGAIVCAVGRNLEKLQNTVEWIKAEGGQAFAHSADVTTEKGCQSVAEACMDQHGRIDCLDNNVGIPVAGDVLSLTQSEWQDAFQMNVQSMIMMSKFAIENIIKAGEGGSIVNLSSLSAIRPSGNTVYSVTKGAAISLTTALARDYGRHGIRANCIILGPVFTPLVARVVTSPSAREKRKKASLLNREGSGWDTGNLVRFLCSDQSKWMTGQSFCLDGGASIMGPSRHNDD